MAIKRKFPPRVATVYCSGGCRAKKDEDGALLCAYGCIGCGLCAGTCPVVFTMGDDGLAHGGEIPANQQTEAETARDGCPVSAISIED